MRTFLISRIRSFELLDQSLNPPEEALERSRLKRSTVAVSGVVPHRSRWAVNMPAEQVQWRADQVGQQDVAFTAQMLPPVRERVALVALQAGPGIDLNDPTYDEALTDMAQRLWEHHGLDEP